MTIAELSGKLGCTRAHVSGIEKGLVFAERMRARIERVLGLEKYSLRKECRPADSVPLRTWKRGECKAWCRPCPMVSCKYHLAVDVRGRSVIEREGWLDDGLPTCALDVTEDREKGG
jgi:hypothetical protein